MKKKKYVYALKSVNADMTSHNGFNWKKKGIVTAPDWNNKPECGGGLHAFLNGEGDGGLANWSDDAVWLVLKVEDGTYLDLGGKIKFPKCEVLCSGKKEIITAKIQSLCPGASVIGGHATAGYGGQATAGDRGQATAGGRGHATAGDWGHATAGDEGHATAGDWGHATAGDEGQATAGDWGKATAGDRGHATAGYRGIVQLSYFVGRWRIKTGYVGEDGIKPNTPYRLNDKHEFEEVK